MNIEQVEGQLAEYEGKKVSVSIPIRSTVNLFVNGKLEIRQDWEQHIISYGILSYGPVVVNFQAQDVHEIYPKPTKNLEALIILKSDICMEQSKCLNE